MKSIDIFLASSCEMSDWRNRIGDAIRRLSDEYEPRGYRIRLKCWEDYMPEFTGIRKQTEYNEDLVKKSDIFIGMFRNNCGKYTQEEVRLGKTEQASHLHILYHSEKPINNNISQFLESISLVPTSVDNIDDAIDIVRNAINQYISSGAESREIVPSTIDTANVYATIGGDLHDLRYELGNAIRSLDNLSESKLARRVRLKMQDLTQIQCSHYYLCILHSIVSPDDKDEILKALTLTSPLGHPSHLRIYYTPNSNALKDNVDIKDALQCKGDFSVDYTDLNLIKLNLLIWLLGEDLLEIDEETGFSISEGWLCFMKTPVIAKDSLSFAANCTDGKVLVRLVGYANKIMMFGQVHRSEIQMTEEDIDRGIAECQIKGGIIDALNKDNIGNLKTLNDEIDSQLIQYYPLDSNVRNKEDVIKIVKLLNQRIEVGKQLVETGQMSAMAVLRTMRDIVKIHDNFPIEFIATKYDIDEHFKKIADFADKHSILNAQVEMMRMNYANSLARDNRNKEALSIYKSVFENIERINDNSPLLIHYISRLYMNYINELLDLGYDGNAYHAILQFKETLNRWRAENKLAIDNAPVYESFITSLLLKFGPIGEGGEAYNKYKKLIEDAFDLSKRIKVVEIEEDNIDDTICFLRIVLSAAVTDHMRLSEKQLIIRTHALLNELIELLQSGILKDKGLTYHYLAEAYHNKSFLSGKQRNQNAEYENIILALKYRRKKHEITQNAEDLGQIARTLINAAASFVNYWDVDYQRANVTDKDFNISLTYAQEALELYTQLNTEHHPNQITDIYKAKLLLGSILYRSKDVAERQEGLKLVKECRDWSNQNANYYSDEIEFVSNQILSHQRLINPFLGL